MPHPTRRRLLHTAAALPALCAIPATARGQDAPPPKPAAAPATRPAIEPLNRFPRMVQEYFVRRVREAERAADVVRDSLRTREDAERYVADVRRKIAESFGPFPERTPLHARTTATLDRDAYTIELVTFESRPNFVVTANLYLPK